MTHPDEPEEPLDPELEALLEGVPPETRASVRGIISRQRSDLTTEQWAAIREIFVSDLTALREKQDLERKLAELEEEGRALEESMKKLKSLIDEMNAAVDPRSQSVD